MLAYLQLPIYLHGTYLMRARSLYTFYWSLKRQSWCIPCCWTIYIHISKCLPALNTRIKYEIARNNVNRKNKKIKNTTKKKIAARDRLFCSECHVCGLKASSIKFIKQLETLNLVVCTCDLLRTVRRSVARGIIFSYVCLPFRILYTIIFRTSICDKKKNHWATFLTINDYC